MITITGGTGLVGRRVLEALSDKKIEYSQKSFRNVSSRQAKALVSQVTGSNSSCLLILSWPASSNPNYRTSLENQECRASILRIAEACVSAGLPVYLLGSILEFSPVLSAYSVAKRELKESLQFEINAGRVIWLRPHFVFEPFVWPNYLRRTESQVEILNDEARDFILVQDVANAILDCIEYRLEGEIDIATGTLRRPSDLLQTLNLPFRIGGQALNDLPAPIQPSSRLLSVGWIPRLTAELLRPV